MKLKAPGLRWVRWKTYHAVYWRCRDDLVSKGYPVKNQKLWSGPKGTLPTDAETDRIVSECKRLQYEMLDWSWAPSMSKKMRKAGRNGNIYFVRSGPAIKIGFAINVEKRVAMLNTAHPVPLELMGSMPGTPVDELRLHKRFVELRLNGEWFRADKRLLEFIQCNTRNPNPTLNVLGMFG